MSNEWIEWNGGKMPVDDDVIVEVQCIACDGSSYEMGSAVSFTWGHIGSVGGIIKYRLHTEEPEKASSTSNGLTADYYELPANAKQLQDLISFKDMNAQVGESFRSLYRYGQSSHSDKLRDAKKVLFYMQAEIERLEKYE